MSRNPQQSNPFRPQDARDPFGSPTPSFVHPAQPSGSDMDHYDKRETFQTEASGVSNAHDYDLPFDPDGELPHHFSLPLFCKYSPLFPSS